MSWIKLRDEDIARAAALVCEAMILPEPKDCRYTFSEAFERKMERLIRAEKRHSNGRMFLKHALAIVVAAMLGMTTWLAIDTDARAAFTKWIREVYENCIVYRSMGEEASAEIPAFTIANMSKEYMVVRNVMQKDCGYVIWENRKNPKDKVLLNYKWNDSSGLNLVLDPSEYSTKKVNVGQCEAEWYEAKRSDKSNLLIWVDGERDIIFSIDTIRTILDTLHMAEDIYLVK